MNAAAKEQLRQEGEAFDVNKHQSQCWFALRLCMGYGAFMLLIGVFVLCGFAILNHAAFSAKAVDLAAAGLGVDLLGFLIAVWRMVLNPAAACALQPVTGLHAKASPGL